MRGARHLTRLAAALWLVTAPSVSAQSLGSVLAGQANLTTFRRLVQENQDVYTDLPKDGVTIIAPNDGAFVKGQGWDSDESSIPKWLQYGILSGRHALEKLAPGDTQTIPTLLTDKRFANVTNGQKVLVTVQPGGEVVLTSGAGTHVTVVKADVPFDGGLVQIIESLMVTPRRLEGSIRDSYTDLTGFLGALYRAELVDEFAETANSTILAPHNAAWQRFGAGFESMGREELRRVLRYHLVPGRTDLLIANGIIQVVDAVLNVDEGGAKPDVTASAQAPAFTFAEEEASGTGTAADVPFTSALPCTAECTTATSRGPQATGATEGNGGGTANGDDADSAAGRAREMAGVTGLFAGILGILLA
ncbi:conserved hypothetical protein [Verticillium alfalfae VaMs.102]|uniref:FAS1 domain-containing protein n=1 Tax=Verticillium alfalfae (strain VaMs.102 / ATCC MYA-4576 / FGSC 10136) TaxID=526221 RepID=C9SMX8_VERA1|nr:conserved hypothetical protein [Verticillium alfalfae VaMs.102]EEY20143.1 conserved hypothetical protein [Verticillium alfalfae VaMs.102]